MASFFIALSTVAVMLLYACPGFLMVKSGLIKGEAVSAFAKLLMYVCSPALIIYSLSRVEFSLAMLADMLFVFFFVLVLMVTVLLSFRFIFRKKIEDVRYRVYTLSLCFSNCALWAYPF